MWIAFLTVFFMYAVMHETYNVSFAYLRDYRKTKRAMNTPEGVCVYQTILVPMAIVMGEWWFFHQ